MGRGSKRDPQFAEMIETACKFDKPVRIGVNWGSLDQDLLTRMMDENSKLAAPLPAIEISDPKELRRRATASVKELLGRIADRGPLVLWIDDLQWGDLDSISLLKEVLRPPEPPPILLCLAFRSEEAESSPVLRAELALIQTMRLIGRWHANADVLSLYSVK